MGRKGTFCSAYQAQKGCPVAVRKSKDILLKFVLDLSGTLKSVSLKSSSENRPSPTGKLGRYMRSYSAFFDLWSDALHETIHAFIEECKSTS